MTAPMTAAAILATAAALVGGDRAATHGPKRENHGKIAALWNAYLAIRREPASPLGPADVARMMALLKIARSELGRHNGDDAVDAAAYCAIAGEIDDEDAALAGLTIDAAAAEVGAA